MGRELYKNFKLREIINLRYGKGLPKRNRIAGDYPVYGSGGIVDTHNEALVEGPGIIIGRKGSIGNVYYEKRSFYPIDTVYYVELKDHKFDLYYLSKLLGEIGLEDLNSDAAVPGLNREIALSQEVLIPSPVVQRKIATILSAYDDLTENNLRRIKILEGIAQNLYREWFVNFRFPGYENARFVDSPLGKIPEGWEIGTVEKTFTILGGGTPSKKVDKYWNNGEINWYTPSDLTAAKSMFIDESIHKITELGLKKSSAKLFPPFSVMMTSRATLGVVSINTTEACTNQGFITCIPNERFPLYFLYFWLKENVDNFINHASGATFKEISKGVFKTIELIIPPVEITDQFEIIIQAMGYEILNLQRKNKNLRQTRDLLLPKLISGEVDVSELDIHIPEEVAI